MLTLRIALLAAVLAACNVAGATSGLEGRTFLSTGVTVGGANRALVPGTQVRIAFDDATSFGASAGCNTMGGTYRIVDGRLRIESGGMTAMGCDDERHAQDDWLNAFLATGPAVALAGSDLALTSGDTVIRLVDREVAEPDQPLVGPVWTIDSIIAGDVVSSAPVGVVATLQFAPDGSVAVNTGCNTGTGRVELAGDSIRFTEVALTRKACPGPEGQLESEVLAVLGSNPATVAIEADRLTITTPGGGLGLVAR